MVAVGMVNLKRGGRCVFSGFGRCAALSAIPEAVFGIGKENAPIAEGVILSLGESRAVTNGLRGGREVAGVSCKKV